MSEYNTGDKCPCGKGRFTVRTSRPKTDAYQDQTLQCNACGKQERALVPAERVWRRA